MLHLAIPQTQLPLEVLDKVINLLDKASLPQAALVCSRWQLLCQRRLFVHFAIDPSKEHGIYYPQHSHLLPNIKELTLRGEEWNNLHPNFNDLLCGLTRLEMITFLGEEFYWDQLSRCSISAFRYAFALHSLVAIKIFSRGTFPLPFLFGCGPHLEQVEILGADTTLGDPLGLDLTAPKTPIYLGSLSLTGNDNIDQVRRFILDHHNAMGPHISLTVLRSLSIVYDDFGDDPRGGELVGQFLDAFGTSVQSLHIQFDLDVLTGLQTAGTIPVTYLQNLTNISCLTASMGLHGLILEDIAEAPICRWVLPLLGLPSSRLLRWLNVEVQLFFHAGHPCPRIHDMTRDINRVLNRISSVISDSTSLLGLEAVNFRVDLYEEGDRDVSPWTEVSLKQFPQLEAKNIKVTYRWSDPSSRLQGWRHNSAHAEDQG